MQGHEHHAVPESFPTDTKGLPQATRSQVAELRDGDEFELEIVPVSKRIGDATVRMLAYNHSIPGPTIKLPQGGTATVHVTNHGDLEATVHWHGLRLENRFDGTHDTQAPIPVGETFSYEITVPDPGAYWYHPHIREDYGQELGLYGNILVAPAEPDYWPPANRELLLTLDDVLIEDGKLAPFSETETTHVAMGRFGNVMLVAGEPDLSLTAMRGEVVRLYLTNTANTRVFNVTIPGAQVKLVGADSGHYEHEELVDEVLIAPSERVVVDVHFPAAGELTLDHKTPDRTYTLATIAVEDTPGRPRPQRRVRYPADECRHDRRARAAGHLLRCPAGQGTRVRGRDGDAGSRGARRLRVPHASRGGQPGAGQVSEMRHEAASDSAPAETSFVCPMHPEVTSNSADRCPKCGMKLVPAGLVGSGAEGAHGDHEHQHEHGDHEGHHDHGHPEHEHDHHAGHDHAHGHAAQGIEWEDDMVEVNRMTTPSNTRWKLIDRETGAENAAIDWRFRVGDRVKIRLVNEMDSDHPMPHPFHVHGAGRFLILARDDVEERNLVWKDTVLVRTGETVDILLDVTNPGTWMAHCHIAEHHESGMMLTFQVDDSE